MPVVAAAGIVDVVVAADYNRMPVAAAVDIVVVDHNHKFAAVAVGIVAVDYNHKLAAADCIHN